jgi:hypothetical protein
MSKSTYYLLQRVAIKGRQVAYKNRVSEPYLSGAAFANLADLVIRDEIDLKAFLELQLIPRITFCRSDLVTQLRNKHIKQNNGQILIAGNGDFDFNDSATLPHGNFQTFYLQNSSISDNKKIFTLPIGVENLSLGINGLPKNLVSTQDWKERSKKIMVGPFSPTHQERQDLLKKAGDSEGVFQIVEGPISPGKFAKLMLQFRYVACPRGNGMDTHRFWETLYRGSVPVVKRNKWSESLLTLKIPFVVVEDWDETPDAIEAFEKSFTGFNPKNIGALWTDYWRKKLAKTNLVSN